MKLKTYTADTMAQALAQVRKDLGKDAMILHTRSFRVGSWFGFGGKNMVEITASSPAPKQNSRTNPATQPQKQRSSQPSEQQEPEIVVQRGQTVTRQRLASSTVEAKPVVAAMKNEPGYTESASAGQPDPRGLEGRDALFSAKGNRASTELHNDRISDKPLPRIRIDRKQVIQPSTPEPPKPPKSAPAAPSSNAENAELRAQLESMQKMMGQVLESTRKTAVAVETGKGEGTLPTGEMPAPLFEIYTKLIDNDVRIDLADKIVGAVRDELDAVELRDPVVVRQAVLRKVEDTIRTRSESLLTIDHVSTAGRPRVIALVGPTGVGKTTTVAKLAATYKLRHQKKVGLITSDTYRIAAVEQLKTYAGIIGLPLKVANSPQEMADAIEELSECDIVVIDTAGRSQNDSRRLEELAEFAAAAQPDETHLVLSTTVGDNVLRKTADRFKALGPDRCILTKLDEAVTTGPIAGLCDRIGLPLSFVTVGQEVPDDLEPARVDRLARCVLDGPDAMLRREDEDNG